jgi:hypothetical protein
MKLVVLIMSCRKYRETRQAAVRNTWLKHVSPDITYVFIEGVESLSFKYEYLPEENRLFVNCADTYTEAALKCKLAIEFISKEFNPDYLIKCDDDTYINYEKLNTLMPREVEYIGSRRRLRRIRYVDGGCYILSRKAVQLVADYDYKKGEGRGWWHGAGINDKYWDVSDEVKRTSAIEDMMVGDILNQNGIKPHHGKRIMYSCREFSGFPGDFTELDFSYFSYHPVLPDDMVVVYETQMAVNYE